MSSDSRKESLRSSPDLPAAIRVTFGAMGVLSVTFVAVLLATSGGSAESSGAVSSLTGVEGPVGEEFPGSGLALRVNDRVDEWIDRLLGPDRASFEAFLVREGLYGGMIRERLRARGMPEELLYLAMIESGFSTSATSRDAASGVWQFMDETAKAYGLTVNEWVDERRDPVRATDAALDYLEELHAMFGSWYLAAAAYNAGPTRLAAALARHGGDDWTDEDVYWEIAEHLPRETRDYVPKMLAATIIAQRPEHFGFEVVPSLPYLFERVFVPGGTALTKVALALAVEPALIRELNPHLIRGVTPPGESYLLRVPLGDSHRLVASMEEVLE